MTLLRHKKQQFGFAPVVLVFIIGAVVAGIVGGYTLMNKGGNSMLPSLKGMTLNSTCEYNDPDLCKYINRVSTDATLYENTTMKSSMRDEEGVESKFVFENAGPDKSHTVSYQGEKEMFNTITLGDTVYTKDMTDNKWWKQTYKKDDAKTEEVKNDNEEIKDLFSKEKLTDDKTEFKKIGKEACGNLMCFKYEIISTSMGDSKSYIYFDDKEYILRKMATITDGIENVTDFSYGGVKITEPSPVKEVPEGQVPGVPADLYSAPSEEEVQKMMEGLQQGQEGGANPAYYEDTNDTPADDAVVEY